MAQANWLRMSSTSKVILGVVFLMVGCAIYLLFRSKSLNIYLWCSALGLTSIIDYSRIFVNNWSIPDFVKFSLPDGLYCAAYILIMDAIWEKDESTIKHFIISLAPALTILFEILQYFGVVKGTFDFRDLVFYGVPFMAYYFCKYYSFKFNNFKNQRL